MQIYLYEKDGTGLSDDQIKEALLKSLAGRMLRRVLIIPPDFTRFHSNAGFITNIYYNVFVNLGCEVDILPALGTHEFMTREQCGEMFGNIPYEKLIPHNWRKDIIKIGEVPADYMFEITEGLWNESISVEINRLVMDPSYDLILSIGQVVPHEVIGMANHTKNIFVGVGGSDVINKSHMVGAVYGMERMMGKDHTPVRKMFDYCMEQYIKNLPILYILTVTTTHQGHIRTHGLFIGEGREPLSKAISLSQQKNINFVQNGIRKCVVYLDPKEFKSTWLGNKAIYRTRMAIEDGGELIILAPGITRFGEDFLVNGIIRKYGYCGRLRILELFQKSKELRENMGTAAHLIHGSSDGRFNVNYAVKDISREEIERVHFRSSNYNEMILRYNPKGLDDGYNTLPDGEQIYFISNPALGLWIDKNRFNC